MVGIGAKKHVAVSGFLRGKEFGKHVPNSWDFPFLDLPHRVIYQKDVKGHYGCVNAIEASTDENFLASGMLAIFVFLFFIILVFSKKKSRNTDGYLY